MDLVAEVGTVLEEFEAQLASFGSARSWLASLSPSALPSDLAAERSRLVSWGNAISGTVEAAYRQIQDAWAALIGDGGLGVLPVVPLVALGAVAAAGALLTKYLLDYATFREKVAMLKSGASPAQVAALDAAPLLSASPAFAWAMGAAAVVAVVVLFRGRR
jgi:hypothetical protein